MVHFKYCTLILSFLSLSVFGQDQIPYDAQIHERFVHDSLGYTLRGKDRSVIEFGITCAKYSYKSGFGTFEPTWNKDTVLYFVYGTTSATHSINIKFNSQKLVNHTGTMTGSPTQGDGKVSWNGTTQRMKMNMVMTVLPQNDNHLSYYCYTTNNNVEFETGSDGGSVYFTIGHTGTNLYVSRDYSGSAITITQTVSPSANYLLASRTGSTAIDFYWNGFCFTSGTGCPYLSTSSSSTSVDMWVGEALGVYTTKDWGGGSYGGGFTTGQAQSDSYMFIMIKWIKDNG